MVHRHHHKSKETASKNGDAVHGPSKSMTSNLGGDVERRTVKRVV